MFKVMIHRLQFRSNMTSYLIRNFLLDRKRRNLFIISFLLALTLATIILDYLEAYFHQSSFYISESLLFSWFWMIFFPLLNFQIHFAKQVTSFVTNLLIAVILVAAHLIVYPGLVWLLSKIFYYHTFSYSQTFQFGVISHSLQATLIYGARVFYLSNSKAKQQGGITINEAKEPKSEFLSSLIVTSTNNQKVSIRTEDVYYFSANPPYISIMHKVQKYLHSATLKSLSSELDDRMFVRIHKSFIVNILYVTSYKSRGNGDYDLTLKNGTELRVSRNYASAFKRIFENSHHLTTG